jgi:hypothetical protein
MELCSRAWIVAMTGNVMVEVAICSSSMGIDLQFFAYDGTPLSDEELAQVLREGVSPDLLFRHASSFGDRLHLVALYEGPESPQRVWREHVAERARAHQPPPEEMPTGSLGSVVQAAWKATRKALDESPPMPKESAESHALAAARALSRTGRRTIWLSQADHSGVGGYAAFADGNVVDQANDDGVYVDGSDYLGVPARKWAEATGSALTPEEAFARAFPDEGDPPVRRASAPGEAMTFDPIRFEVI